MIDAGSSPAPGARASQASARARSGSPTDALAALAGTVSSEAKQARFGRADRRVSVAFALGWQVAELYRPDRGKAAAQPVSEDDLPGLSRLSDGDWTEIGLDQAQADIAKLWGPIFDAGLEPPDAQYFASTVNATTDEAVRAQAMKDFHVDLLAILTAADFRLGKAYGVGRRCQTTTRLEQSRGTRRWLGEHPRRPGARLEGCRCGGGEGRGAGGAAALGSRNRHRDL